MFRFSFYCLHVLCYSHCILTSGVCRDVFYTHNYNNNHRGEQRDSIFVPAPVQCPLPFDGEMRSPSSARSLPPINHPLQSFLASFSAAYRLCAGGLKIIIIVIIRPHHRRMDRFYPRDAMIARVLAMALCPCLCVSVCLSQVGVLWKWMDRSNWFLAWEISLTYTVL